MNQEYYMKRALALARRGIGRVAPNPMVGCLVVKNNLIIGKGWHEFYGGDHAEVMALKDAGEQASGSTLYVTLEPCNHTGKTGPCAEAIIKAGVDKVVYAMPDPNSSVTGGGG